MREMNFPDFESLSPEMMIKNKQRLYNQIDFQVILLISIGSIFNHSMLLINSIQNLNQAYKWIELFCLGIETFMFSITILLRYTNIIQKIIILNLTVLIYSLLSQSVLIYILSQAFSPLNYTHHIQLAMIIQIFTVFLFPNTIMKILAILLIVSSKFILFL